MNYSEKWKSQRGAGYFQFDKKKISARGLTCKVIGVYYGTIDIRVSHLDACCVAVTDSRLCEGVIGRWHTSAKIAEASVLLIIFHAGAFDARSANRGTLPTARRRLALRGASSVC